MIELLGGMVIGGVAGVYAKDKLFGETSQSSNNKRELDALYAENEKFRKRNQELAGKLADMRQRMVDVSQTTDTETNWYR